MPARLLVILGAGASADCVSGSSGEIHDELRPPLVKELFAEHSAFARILHQYPLAEQVAPSLRAATRDGAIALEAYLSEHLRDSPHAFRRKQYWAIPLYLQHLLFAVSNWSYGKTQEDGLALETTGYAAHPDNYDRLLNATLQVDEVTYVTLNYDTLLDQRLDPHGSLDSLDGYLGPDRNWALIKPHGSIDWGRKVMKEVETVVARSDPFLARTFAALGEEISLSDDITLRRRPSVATSRGLDVKEWGGARTGRDLYYPALSAPLGPDDELTCPPSHIQYLKDITGHWDPLDALVIGYSGLDRGVLDLLSWGGRNLRSLAVVSDSRARERCRGTYRVLRPG